jgi:hypothetical protein
MFRRMFIGLLVGLIVGGLVAAGLVAGLGIPSFSIGGGAVLAYLAAAVTGVLTGLVAGKPIWSSGAKIEAGLKAVFGAFLGAGLMFALRQWAGSWPIASIPAIGVASGAAVGNLPAISLPLLAAVLGGFFEIDNTGDDKTEGKAGPSANERKRVAASSDGQGKRVDASSGVVAGDSDDETELGGGRRAKR